MTPTIGRTLCSSLWRLSRRLIGRGRRRPLEGVPEGIAFEELEGACEAVLGGPLIRVSHMQLSGWKRTGAYRLWLDTARGDSRTVIFKNARFDPAAIPALNGLPALPGPPEYHVYHEASWPFDSYLPRVYLCEEVTKGTHYRYVLEDLAADRRVCESHEAILAQAKLLPALHRVMKAWWRDAYGAEWLDYGHEYSLALQEYVITHLSRYANRSEDSLAVDFCERFSRIAAIHAGREFHDICPRRPIHGDYNPWNVLIRDGGEEPPKIIDWEWAGLGMPHMDLASLLKPVPNELAQRALALFASEGEPLPLREHQRLYSWCKLERGMLDAAFLAVQQMEGRWGTRLHLPRRIAASIRRALGAFEELS